MSMVFTQNLGKTIAFHSLLETHHSLKYFIYKYKEFSSWLQTMRVQGFRMYQLIYIVIKI